MAKGTSFLFLVVCSVSLAQAMGSREAGSATGNQSTGVVQRMDHAMHELQLATGPVDAASSDEESSENKSVRALVRGFESAARRFSHIRPVSNHQKNIRVLQDIARCAGELHAQIAVYDSAHNMAVASRLGRALRGVEEAQARIQNYESGHLGGDSDAEGSDDELEIITHTPPVIGLSFSSRAGQ